MNRRVIFLSVIAIALAFLLLLKNSDKESDEVDIAFQKTQSVKQSEKHSAKQSDNSQKVANLDESKLTEKKEKPKKQVRLHVEIEPQEVVEAEQTTSYDTLPKKSINIKREDIPNYLAEKSLVNITSTKSELANPDYTSPRFSVYTNISKKEASEKRDNTFPPSAPKIINGSFHSGLPFTVIIDADINKEADDIVVSNNHPDGSIQEIINIKEKEAEDAEHRVIMAPPSIGKN